jgi:hypothetical protein
VLAWTPAASGQAPTTVTFSAVGAEQGFTVPANVFSVSATAIGGKGGNGSGASGGFGAVVSGTIAVTPGEVLYIEVGDNGRSGSSAASAVFNGGGLGTNGSASNGTSGSGGGATDIRTCPRAFNCPLGGAGDPRLLVAGGGGGGGAETLTFAGGAGGGGGTSAGSGANGADSPNGTGGRGGGGGTLTAGGSGGAAGSGNNPAGLSGTDGAAGQGGAGRDSGNTNSPGGGGGGGYFGGGGGGAGSRDSGGQVAGGGGGGAGSSFLSSQVTHGAIATDATGTPEVSLTFTPNFAAASVTPSGLTFAGQAPGTLSVPQTVTIANTGQAPLEISGLTFGGANPGDFLDGGDNCRGAVAPGSSCTASIFFVPHAAGPSSATLVVASNDPSGERTVLLSGSGAAPPTGTTAPVSRFEIVRIAVSRSGTINVTLHLDGPGRAIASASYGRAATYGSASASAQQGGTVVLRIHPRPAARARVRRDRKRGTGLKAKLVITFSETGAIPGSKSRTVAVVTPRRR